MIRFYILQVILWEAEPGAGTEFLFPVEQVGWLHFATYPCVKTSLLSSLCTFMQSVIKSWVETTVFEKPPVISWHGAKVPESWAGLIKYNSIYSTTQVRLQVHWLLYMSFLVTVLENVCDWRPAWWKSMWSGSWTWSQLWGRETTRCRNSTCSCTARTCSTCSCTPVQTLTVSHHLQELLGTNARSKYNWGFAKVRPILMPMNSFIIIFMSTKTLSQQPFTPVVPRYSAAPPLCKKIIQKIHSIFNWIAFKKLIWSTFSL